MPDHPFRAGGPFSVSPPPHEPPQPPESPRSHARSPPPVLIARSSPSTPICSPLAFSASEIPSVYSTTAPPCKLHRRLPRLIPLRHDSHRRPPPPPPLPQPMHSPIRPRNRGSGYPACAIVTSAPPHPAPRTPPLHAPPSMVESTSRAFTNFSAPAGDEQTSGRARTSHAPSPSPSPPQARARSHPPARIPTLPDPTIKKSRSSSSRLPARRTACSYTHPRHYRRMIRQQRLLHPRDLSSTCAGNCPLSSEICSTVLMFSVIAPSRFPISISSSQIPDRIPERIRPEHQRPPRDLPPRTSARTCTTPFPPADPPAPGPAALHLLIELCGSRRASIAPTNPFICGGNAPQSSGPASATPHDSPFARTERTTPYRPLSSPAVDTRTNASIGRTRRIRFAYALNASSASLCAADILEHFHQHGDTQRDQRVSIHSRSKIPARAQTLFAYDTRISTQDSGLRTQDSGLNSPPPILPARLLNSRPPHREEAPASPARAPPAPPHPSSNSDSP